VYEGAKLQQLRQPVLYLLSRDYGRNISPEDETEAGEFYIDTVAVHHNHQGKGLGTKPLKLVIGQIVQQEGGTVGLLVDVDNPKAKNLYLQVGFKKVGEKPLMGHPYEHLQVRPRPTISLYSQS